MTTFEQNNQTEISDIRPKSSSSSSPSQKMLSFWKVLEYLCLGTFIASGIITFVLPDNPKIVIIDGISLGIFVFLFLINLQMSKAARQAGYQSDMQKKAELYLMNNQKGSMNNLIAPAREKALGYAQELIDDYKKTRRQSRNLYYILQIGTVILSGITPILVLVDKLQANQTWLKWLPVIFPAVASIVASVVTSFPLQETWISANRTVELLEAEQEKFVLGITPLYRCYDSINEDEQQNKAKKSIENFITQVNKIHLKQVEGNADNKTQEFQGEQDNNNNNNSNNIQQLASQSTEAIIEKS